MSEIVKVCEMHGSLTIDQTYEEKVNNGLSFGFRCKQCRSDYEVKNKERRLAYSREYERTKRKRPPGYNELHNERYRVKARERRRKNADAINEKIREDRKINPEKYLQREHYWRSNNLEKARFLDVVKKHNITYDEYMWMMDLQAGKCFICGKEERKKSRTKGQLCRLAIDHNHKTGQIRKLLCHHCNAGIGHFFDDIDLMQKAIEYLKKHNTKDGLTLENEHEYK